MGWSLRLGRLAGTELRIHVTFFLFLLWIAVGHYAEGGTGTAVVGVTFTLLVFGCVVLHEFGHAVAARRYGIHTPDITLLPIGGVARLTRMPNDPRQELVIALAGPAVNVLIAAVLIVNGYRLDLTTLFDLNSERVTLGDKLLDTNVFLLLFNLLPAFPMDGGRVLRAVLAMRMNYVRATELAARVGQGFAFFFGFVGLITNPILLLIALFVYLGAAQEAAVAQMRNITARLPVSAAMVRDFQLLPLDASAYEAVELLLSTSQHEFPVVDDAGRLRGIVTRDALISALRRGYRGAVADLMHPDVPAVSWTAALDEAFELMTERQCPALAVVNDMGQVIGIVTPENIGEMLLVHDSLGEQRQPWIDWQLPQSLRRSS
jgi:Zn-dependent protease/CBS domain-containing protein